jgi:2-polyprenyl-3-methyl-5-hydroxy-6-metoxy-1,4-benzoquinol methylase
MRNQRCPICGLDSPAVLQLEFKEKMNLPTQAAIRICAPDNFLFVGSGDQRSYDEYYRSLANDSYHGELAAGDAYSPIAKLQRHRLTDLLGDFFSKSRKVLDFGCGEGWLLQELASTFPSSIFCGVDPSPAARVGSEKAKRLGSKNLFISQSMPDNVRDDVRYDLVIASHLVEHLVDFDLLHLFSALLTEDGLLYVEVPNSLQYRTYERLEFLYYFDRIHVNHFTPESLVRLLSAHGFGHVGQIEYSFPYRDGNEYPALGMLFKKGGGAMDIQSASILEATSLYISQEQERARALNQKLKTFKGLLVWGAGDNFFRSIENDGPLSNLSSIVVLDQHPQTINIGSRRWETQNPAASIRRYQWPVVITVSEGRKNLARQIQEIDPSRQVFFV